MFNLLIKLEPTNQAEARINASNEADRGVQPVKAAASDNAFLSNLICEERGPWLLHLISGLVPPFIITTSVLIPVCCNNLF